MQPGTHVLMAAGNLETEINLNMYVLNNGGKPEDLKSSPKCQRATTLTLYAKQIPP